MYTIDETGVLNNYAIEPQTYLAEYPSPEQQQRYILQAGLSSLLVTAILCVAFVVS
jgi:hypothetical protein